MMISEYLTGELPEIFTACLSGHSVK